MQVKRMRSITTVRMPTYNYLKFIINGYIKLQAILISYKITSKRLTRVRRQLSGRHLDGAAVAGFVCVLDNIFGVALRVVEDDEDCRVVHVVYARIVAPSVRLCSVDRRRLAIRTLSGDVVADEHSSQKHAVNVRRRVGDARLCDMRRCGRRRRRRPEVICRHRNVP